MKPVEIGDIYDLSALLERLQQQQQQSTEPKQISEPINLTEFVNHVLNHGQPPEGVYTIYQTRLETVSEVQVRVEQELYERTFL